MLMAYLTKKDQMRYIEFGSFTVDLTEGDVLLLDPVNDLTPLFPLKSSTTLIAICFGGTQKLTCDGHEIEICPGNILVTPSKRRVLAGDHSKDFECKVLCISDHVARGLLRDKVNYWHNESNYNQAKLLEMSEFYKEDFPVYLRLIHSKLKPNYQSAPYEILLALLRAFLLEVHTIIESSNGTSCVQRLSQGKLLFNRFLSLVSGSKVKRQPITFYAGQLAITPKYLTMLCLKYSNKTASEWVAQYTVEEIRFYLKSTDLSIKEISALMGFSNMSHFGSYVRKHFGVSPSEYRYSKKN